MAQLRSKLALLPGSRLKDSITQKLYSNKVKSTVVYNIYNITIIEQSADELQDAHNTVT